jgi:hypothetical protein
MEYEFDLQSVVCIQVIAENLSEEEIAGLKEMFKMMDTDNSGQINFEELKAGLQRVGANMKEPEIYQLMQAVSLFCLISSLRHTCMDKETGEFSSIVANIQKKMLIILIVQETIPVAIYALFIGMLAG